MDKLNNSSSLLKQPGEILLDETLLKEVSSIKHPSNLPAVSDRSTRLCAPTAFRVQFSNGVRIVWDQPIGDDCLPQTVNGYLIRVAKNWDRTDWTVVSYTESRQVAIIVQQQPDGRYCQFLSICAVRGAEEGPRRELVVKIYKSKRMAYVAFLVYGLQKRFMFVKGKFGIEVKEPPQEAMSCNVCGDIALGKYDGIHCCDSCQEFCERVKERCTDDEVSGLLQHKCTENHTFFKTCNCCWLLYCFMAGLVNCQKGWKSGKSIVPVTPEAIRIQDIKVNKDSTVNITVITPDVCHSPEPSIHYKVKVKHKPSQKWKILLQTPAMGERQTISLPQDLFSHVSFMRETILTISAFHSSKTDKRTQVEVTSSNKPLDVEPARVKITPKICMRANVCTLAFSAVCTDDTNKESFRVEFINVPVSKMIKDYGNCTIPPPTESTGRSYELQLLHNSGRNLRGKRPLRNNKRKEVSLRPLESRSSSSDGSEQDLTESQAYADLSQINVNCTRLNTDESMSNDGRIGSERIQTDAYHTLLSSDQTRSDNDQTASESERTTSYNIETPCSRLGDKRTCETGGKQRTDALRKCVRKRERTSLSTGPRDNSRTDASLTVNRLLACRGKPTTGASCPTSSRPSGSKLNKSKDVQPPTKDSPVTLAEPVVDVECPVTLSLLSQYVTMCHLQSIVPIEDQKLVLNLAIDLETKQKIINSRDLNDDYGLQIHMRFCEYDKVGVQKDSVPECLISFNSTHKIIVKKRFMSNQQGEKPENNLPIDITKYLSMHLNVNNVVTVEVNPKCVKRYCLFVRMVRKMKPKEVLNSLKRKGPVPVANTVELVKSKFEVDQDSGISSTIIKARLTCPLSQMRIKVPCRGTQCKHIQCMDALTLLKMCNGKQPTKCFLCDQPFTDIVIDGLFTEILQQVPPDIDEVMFKPDGSCSAVANDGRLVQFMLNTGKTYRTNTNNEADSTVIEPRTSEDCVIDIPTDEDSELNDDDEDDDDVIEISTKSNRVMELSAESEDAAEIVFDAEDGTKLLADKDKVIEIHGDEDGVIDIPADSESVISDPDDAVEIVEDSGKTMVQLRPEFGAVNARNVKVGEYVTKHNNRVRVSPSPGSIRKSSRLRSCSKERDDKAPKASPIGTCSKQSNTWTGILFSKESLDKSSRADCNQILFDDRDKTPDSESERLTIPLNTFSENLRSEPVKITEPFDKSCNQLWETHNPEGGDKTDSKFQTKQKQSITKNNGDMLIKPSCDNLEVELPDANGENGTKSYHLKYYNIKDCYVRLKKVQSTNIQEKCSPIQGFRSDVEDGDPIALRSDRWIKTPAKNSSGSDSSVKEVEKTDTGKSSQSELQGSQNASTSFCHPPIRTMAADAQSKILNSLKQDLVKMVEWLPGDAIKENLGALCSELVVSTEIKEDSDPSSVQTLNSDSAQKLSEETALKRKLQNRSVEPPCKKALSSTEMKEGNDTVMSLSRDSQERSSVDTGLSSSKRLRDRSVELLCKQSPLSCDDKTMEQETVTSAQLSDTGSGNTASEVSHLKRASSERSLDAQSEPSCKKQAFCSEQKEIDEESLADLARKSTEVKSTFKTDAPKKRATSQSKEPQSDRTADQSTEGNKQDDGMKSSSETLNSELKNKLQEILTYCEQMLGHESREPSCERSNLSGEGNNGEDLKLIPKQMLARDTENKLQEVNACCNKILQAVDSTEEVVEIPHVPSEANHIEDENLTTNANAAMEWNLHNKSTVTATTRPMLRNHTIELSPEGNLRKSDHFTERQGGQGTMPLAQISDFKHQGQSKMATLRCEPENSSEGCSGDSSQCTGDEMEDCTLAQNETLDITFRNKLNEKNLAIPNLSLRKTSAHTSPVKPDVNTVEIKEEYKIVNSTQRYNSQISETLHQHEKSNRRSKSRGTSCDSLETSGVGIREETLIKECLRPCRIVLNDLKYSTDKSLSIDTARPRRKSRFQSFEPAFKKLTHSSFELPVTATKPCEIPRPSVVNVVYPAQMESFHINPVHSSVTGLVPLVSTNKSTFPTVSDRKSTVCTAYSEIPVPNPITSKSSISVTTSSERPIVYVPVIYSKPILSRVTYEKPTHSSSSDTPVVYKVTCVTPRLSQFSSPRPCLLTTTCENPAVFTTNSGVSVLSPIPCVMPVIYTNTCNTPVHSVGTGLKSIVSSPGKPVSISASCLMAAGLFAKSKSVLCKVYPYPTPSKSVNHSRDTSNMTAESSATPKLAPLTDVPDKSSAFQSENSTFNTLNGSHKTPAFTKCGKYDPYSSFSEMPGVVRSSREKSTVFPVAQSRPIHSEVTREMPNLSTVIATKEELATCDPGLHIVPSGSDSNEERTWSGCKDVADTEAAVSTLRTDKEKKAKAYKVFSWRDSDSDDYPEQNCFNDDLELGEPVSTTDREKAVHKDHTKALKSSEAKYDHNCVDIDFRDVVVKREPVSLSENEGQELMNPWQVGLVSDMDLNSESSDPVIVGNSCKRKSKCKSSVNMPTNMILKKLSQKLANKTSERLKQKTFGKIPKRSINEITKGPKDPTDEVSINEKTVKPTNKARKQISASRKKEPELPPVAKSAVEDYINSTMKYLRSSGLIKKHRNPNRGGQKYWKKTPEWNDKTS